MDTVDNHFNSVPFYSMGNIPVLEKSQARNF